MPHQVKEEGATSHTIFMPTWSFFALSVMNIFTDWCFQSKGNIYIYASPQCFSFKDSQMTALRTVIPSAVSFASSDMCWQGGLCWHFQLENIYTMVHV